LGFYCKMLWSLPDMRLVRIAALLATAQLLAACQDLPQQGPTATEILAQGETDDFVVIDVDGAISRTISQFGPRGFSSDFAEAARPVPAIRVQVGDVLSIRIFEASSESLFSMAPTGSTSSAEFPAILVDEAGSISLPYVGRIVVTGKSPGEIETIIAERLTGKAIEPQAMVGILKSAGNSLTLGGDVFRPGKIELSVVNLKLAEVIALAGGSKFPAHETLVSLVRNGQRESVLLDDIFEKPVNNIVVQSGDLVVVSRQLRGYTVMGAVLRGGSYPFADKQVSVLEAIATAGGLADIRADAAGVFVFRYEPRWLLGRLGVADLGRFPADARGIPTVYRFNLKDAKSSFYAQAFRLEDNDGIYVANAESVQLSKLFALFDLGLSPIERASTVAN
jgi:polysaccharide export outer membrane protein